MSLVDLTGRDIVSVDDFDKETLLYLFKMAEQLYNHPEVEIKPVARGRRLGSFFYESSTRTVTSFTEAINRLGGSILGFTGTEETSIKKGETILSTNAMFAGYDIIAAVMRHSCDGAVQWAADVAPFPMINGGDGKNQHPTQTLLDILTLYILTGHKLDGLTVGFGGDLSHGRTVQSLTRGLAFFNDITILWAADDYFGLPSSLQKELETRGVKVERVETARELIMRSPYVYMTRPQKERGELPLEQILEKITPFRITSQLLELNPHTRVLHPLPVDSTLGEIAPEVFTHPQQAFLFQAKMGVYARTALLYAILKNLTPIRYDGTLSRQLSQAQNRLARTTRGEEKDTKRMYIDAIRNGIIIDHIPKNGVAYAIAERLNALGNGYFVLVGHNVPGKRYDLVKTDAPSLPENILKEIAMMAGEPTIDIVREGRIVEKFVYLVCRHPECITRVVPESVPPRFYSPRDGNITCRYCRREYEPRSEKVTAEERAAFIASLPTRIEPVVYK